MLATRSSAIPGTAWITHWFCCTYYHQRFLNGFLPFFRLYGIEVDTREARLEDEVEREGYKMRKLGRIPRFLGLLGLAVALLLGGVSRTASTLPKDSSIMEASVKSPIGSAKCDSPDYPLDCGNGWCCPRGYTLHCPRSTCKGVPDGARGCYNPNTITDEDLAKLRNCCPELASCR